MLVLPGEDTMSERMVKRVGELLDAGARVVAPRRPVRAPGLGRARSPSAASSRPPYLALVDSVWAKGVMECSPTEALKRLGIEPDFSCGLKDVAWIHRTGRARSPSAPSHAGRAVALRPPCVDWYFVACGNKTNLSFEASFRIAGKVPEIWDAETGEIRDAAEWRVEGGRTVVRLDFPPSGSAFVMFRRGTGNGERGTGGRAVSMKPPITGKMPVVPVGGPWKVAFPVDWYTGGSAVKCFDWPTLKDWTSDDDPDVKYFSGTATYGTSVKCKMEDVKCDVKNRTPDVGCRMSNIATWNPSQRLILDLGDVKDFAEVKVNGKSYPPLWRPPFRIDITDAVKAASVQQQGRAVAPRPPLSIDLEIKVTNRWPNRLIGDDILYPDDCEWVLRWFGWQKINELGIKEIPQWVKDGNPSPTGRHTFTTWKHWTKTDHLLPSGLLGPVRVELVK